MELVDKVAIVTGGAVRLGRALALALAEQGARVVVHYGSSTASAKGVVAEIEALGSQAVTVQADLSRPGEVGSVLESALSHFGRVDILVNNAAVFEPGQWDDTTEANWDRHFAINLKSPFFLSQAFAAQFERDRHGHIVNIADWRAVRPGPDYIAYTLTKAALVAMTKSLALALAPNIQVNAIAPGLILPPPGQDQAHLEAKAARIPAQRTGSPSEVARTLVFLLRSDFVTGDLVYVTGGEHL
jgi:NAD(P)-dependent dehydrogenase (short-subunit alcohol dehydrogenase family)